MFEMSLITPVGHTPILVLLHCMDCSGEYSRSKIYCTRKLATEECFEMIFILFAKT